MRRCLSPWKQRDKHVMRQAELLASVRVESVGHVVPSIPRSKKPCVAVRSLGAEEVDLQQVVATVREK